eukprot:s665_g4.t1
MTTFSLTHNHSRSSCGSIIVLSSHGGLLEIWSLRAGGPIEWDHFREVVEGRPKILHHGFHHLGTAGAFDDDLDFGGAGEKLLLRVYLGRCVLGGVLSNAKIGTLPTPAGCLLPGALGKVVARPPTTQRWMSQVGVGARAFGEEQSDSCGLGQPEDPRGRSEWHCFAG